MENLSYSAQILRDLYRKRMVLREGLDRAMRDGVINRQEYLFIANEPWSEDENEG